MSRCHCTLSCSQTDAELVRLRSHRLRLGCGLDAHAACSGRLGAPAIDSAAEVCNDGLVKLLFQTSTKFRVCAAGDGFVASYSRVLRRTSGRTLLFISTTNQADFQAACARTPIGCGLVGASLSTEVQPTLPASRHLWS